jgi:CubicO group peptidase (beta-lactamase class C family)
LIADTALAQQETRQVDSLVRLVAARGQFNGCVLVARDHRVVYAHAFGDADLGRRIPLTLHSSIELASVSKPITALAVMLLEQRGKLSYDDQLVHYFPALPYPGVTIRQMLTHTSGLPDLEPLLAGNVWPPDRIATNADVLAQLVRLHPSPFFSPGQQWRYSPLGYVLLAAIVEKVSGVSFDRVLASNIFGPAGMTDSHVFAHGTSRLVKNIAIGYVRSPSWVDDYVEPASTLRFRYVVPFGGVAGPMGISASALDLERLIEALDKGRLVHAATLEEAYTPARLANGQVASAGGGAGNSVSSAYGFGWFIQHGPDGETVRHTGDWPGYTTDLIHNLDRHYTIVVLSNYEDVATAGVANAIEDILNHQPFTLPPLSISREIGRVMVNEGVQAGIDRYHALKRTRPTDFDFASESELNGLGYEFVRAGMVKNALAVFRLNAESFPGSWNVFDSLGEAYAMSDDTAAAIESYQRSVELNPQNTNGIAALKRLTRR